MNDDDDDHFSATVDRYNTFESFPIHNFDIRNLSIMGFYYTGRGIETKCYVCHIVIDNWTVEETCSDIKILEKHLAINRQCKNANELYLSFNSEYLHTQIETASINVKDILLKADLSIETNRLKTFINWSVENTHSAADMARCGFVFIGSEKSDRVQCVYCLVVLVSWSPEDTIQGEHARHSKNCPMVTNNFDERIVKVNHMPKMGKHVFKSVAEVFEVNNQPQLEDISAKEISYTSEKPHTGSMSNFAKRLETFQTWPLSLTQKPSELAEAGFYFLGTSDVVKCFWCGLNLFNWEPHDEPLSEHQKHHPDCKYLQDRLREKLENEMQHVSLDNELMSVQETDNAPQRIEVVNKVDESDLCKLCFTNPRDTLFLPCRHLIACNRCSINVISKETSLCPFCRTTIKGTVLVYL